jgi:hypothetical protein
MMLSSALYNKIYMEKQQNNVTQEANYIKTRDVEKNACCKMLFHLHS